MEIFPLSQYLSRILIQDWAIELYRGCLAEETENQHFWLNLLHKNLNITIDQVEKYHLENDCFAGHSVGLHRFLQCEL